MVSQAINGLPEGFQYQSAYQKNLRVTGNKVDGVSNIKDAPKVKTLAVTNTTSDTYDKEFEQLVKDIGSIESFRKAYNLEKMKTKQFTFQVLLNDVHTFLDPDKWPESVYCRFWEMRNRNGAQRPT